MNYLNPQESFLNFRLADLEDKDSICDLVNSAYRGESSRKGWTTEADILGGQRVDQVGIAEIIADSDSRIVLCLDNKELIGAVLIQNRINCAYLGMLTVRPDLQASGIGKQLLAAAENSIYELWGIKAIEMTVIQKRISLIEWYQRRGYRITGERRPFPYGDIRFGEPKVNDLEFIVLEKQLIE